MKLTKTSKRKIAKLFFFVIIILFQVNHVQAQGCPVVEVPQLFGNPVDKVVCRDADAQLGVNFSVPTQEYFFRVGTARTIGGPLIGNGGQLSVAARVASSADTGQYFVDTREGAGSSCWARSPGFYVYYGNVDNLSITAWGNNSVSFSWASCGRSPYVRYEYAVTTQSNPDNITNSDTATTFNTSATVNVLTTGNQYYIHVRVLKVYQQPMGNGSFNGPEVSNECFSDYPWSTIRFTSCSGTAAIGSITLSSSIPSVCTGYGITLTASQGLTYQWYRNGTSFAPQGNGASWQGTQSGTYSTYITTSAGCQGMAYSKYIKEKITTPAVFSGGGSFCAGEEVKFKVRATQPDQYYNIWKDGQLVTGFWGIGTSFGSPPTDTMHYNFIITSGTQAGNYMLYTGNGACPDILCGTQNVILLSTGSTGSITGTAIVPQHATNTSTITFTGSGGVKPYTFTYSINGGANQTITTTGTNSSATVTRSQATLGTFVYTLVKITDAPGCTGTVGTPATATISVLLPAPDLTSSQFFSTSQIAAGGAVDELIVVRNVGITATSAPITFSVTNYSLLSGLTVSSNTSPSLTIGFTTYPLDNANWTFNSATGVFTSNAGVAILPNGTRNIGVRITRLAGANGSVTHTATINSGTGGGEAQIANNSISNSLLKN